MVVGVVVGTDMEEVEVVEGQEVRVMEQEGVGEVRGMEVRKVYFLSTSQHLILRFWEHWRTALSTA